MLSNTGQLRQRIVFTLLILIAYRFGTFVPIPGINSEVLNEFFSSSASNIFGMINLFSGGALERMSVFALNIMPYITASIIMQLMTSMYKGLEDLKKGGEQGRAKLNQYTRYFTIILAFFQSIGVYYALSSSGNSAFISDSKILMLTTCTSLVGGTVILMWFGERITASGIGNGISLIIFVGIVSSLPGSITQLFELSRSGVYSWFVVLLILIAFIALLGFICFFEKTSRQIKIQYPNAKMMRAAGSADHSYLPLKINIAGVIPPIFASSILMFPTAIFEIVQIENDFIASMLRRGGAIYLTLFASFIMFFCYFYTSIVFNTKEVASNLKKSNCFMIGVRPGDATERYLDTVISRLTFLGSLYLITICIIPEIFIVKYGIPIYIGGTGALIIVNVILDLIGQVQSHLYSQKFGNNSAKRKRIRVRA